MNVKDKIDIVLITYNRKKLLKDTFEQILGENSPIKDFDITILNNASTDGSTELIDEYCNKYSNIKHIINTKNIGGNANIAKALVEIPKKDYVWVLCDNDTYDWSAWGEIEDAVLQDVDAVFTRNCEKIPAKMFYTATLVSGCIYKTSLIGNTVIENIYDNIKNLFPHLAPIAYIINNNKSVYIVSEDIVYSGINPGHDTSFTRGLDLENLNDGRKNIFWSVGYFNSLELIKNKKIRTQIIEEVRHYHKSLFDLFKTVMVKNKILFNNYTPNLTQIYKTLNLSQKIKFITAFLLINLSFKDYTFYEIRSKEQWKEYFEKINEQEYLNKLAKKLKGKKVILYGAGIISEVINEHYDLSKFNIIGIADKRFERTEEKECLSFKTLKPNELKYTDCDYIFVSLKLFNKIKQNLIKDGVNKKIISLINKNNKYAVRT